MLKLKARKHLIKAFAATNYGMAQEIIQQNIDAREHEHGGWEEVEGEEAEAMLTLGEDETAAAICEGFIKFLKTKTGRDIIKKWNKPYFDYAKEWCENETETG